LADNSCNHVTVKGKALNTCTGVLWVNSRLFWLIIMVRPLWHVLNITAQTQKVVLEV